MKNRDLLLMALIPVALMVRLLLSPPIWHHGEAREGLVVQAIVHDHQWILPFRNGELPSKPPLFHWIAALLALSFGLSDFTVRLPSVIAAEIMAIATFLMGRAIGGRKTAWLAVGALLGMYDFWGSGTQARVDMVLAASTTVSLAGFFFWYRNRNQIARLICYIASACAVLSKGPVGIVLPVLVIAVFLAAEGRLRILRAFWSWPLAGLVIFLDLGWYTLAYRVGGDEFLRLQILSENVDRFFGAGDFTSEHTYLSTVGWLATQTLPWTLVLPWSLIRRLRGEREDAAGHFLHSWWISIFVVFALAARTRAVYLLPMYPAIALLAARAIGAMLSNLAERPTATLCRSLCPLQMAKRVGIGIALFDLGLMLVNPRIWTDMKSRNARLTFIEKIATTVPNHRALFATPNFSGPELIVLAYHLRREIGRKPMTCADQNDYLLSPIESAVAQTRVLASSESDGVELVTVLAEKTAAQNLDNSKRGPSLIHNEQNRCAS